MFLSSNIAPPPYLPPSQNLPNRAPEACPSFLTVPVRRSKTRPLALPFGLPS